MSESSDETHPGGDPTGESDAGEQRSPPADESADDDVEALRREVEEKYDFEDFGPGDMASMSAEEWDAAFDPETWIVGPELVDRVEADLQSRIASRDVFAVLERFEAEGEERLVAYSDEGYAVVYPDGSVEGRGTVVRDVKPTVALCSMDSYEVPEPPDEVSLPAPDDVPEGTGQLGNNLLQVVALAQLLTGVGLLGVWLFTDAVPTPGGYVDLVVPVVALVFVGIAVFLFAVVANARLSDRFRAEEFRDRLRAAGVDADDRPEFLPPLEDPEPERATDADAPDGS